MRIFDNDVVAYIELPDGSSDNMDALLGIHVIQGECLECGEPAIGIQIGFLFFTITITITKSHE